MTSSALSDRLLTAFVTSLLITWMLPAVCLLFSARELISPATTAKPFPASPALAASMEALRARRFVCEAMSRITFVSSFICEIFSLSPTAAIK